MDGTILYFEQLFVLEMIDNTEQPLRRSRSDQRTGTIRVRQAISKGGGQGILRFGLEPENASQKKPKTEKRMGYWRKSGASALISLAKKFSKGNASAVRR